jgi:hypothetical protein
MFAGMNVQHLVDINYIRRGIRRGLPVGAAVQALARMACAVRLSKVFPRVRQVRFPQSAFRDAGSLGLRAVPIRNIRPGHFGLAMALAPEQERQVAGGFSLPEQLVERSDAVTPEQLAERSDPVTIDRDID